MVNNEADSSSAKLGFIGGGNMAEAMIAGFIVNGCEPSKICVSAPRAERRDALHRQYCVTAIENNMDVVDSSDIVVLAVKPDKIQEVCDEIILNRSAESLPLIISAAAGIPLNLLSKCLANTRRVIAAMPNLPSAVGEGMTCLFSDTVAESDRALASQTLSCIGQVQWMDKQDDMHIAVSAAGSAPAYFFLMLEAMQNAAKHQGLDDDVARRMVLQTAQGAIKMAVEENCSFKSLRQRVTSPKGTTHSAIQSFENNDFRSLVATAMESAACRSRELASNTNVN